MTYDPGRIYKKIEVIGISSVSIEDAIQHAVTKANESLERLSWFEVLETRGHIDVDGKVSEYQVTVKIAFALQ